MIYFSHYFLIFQQLMSVLASGYTHHGPLGRGTSAITIHSGSGLPSALCTLACQASTAGGFLQNHLVQ